MFGMFRAEGSGYICRASDKASHLEAFNVEGLLP